MFFKGKACFGRLPAAGREWENDNLKMKKGDGKMHAIPNLSDCRGLVPQPTNDG